jgi:hypothetical protein
LGPKSTTTSAAGLPGIKSGAATARAVDNIVKRHLTQVIKKLERRAGDTGFCMATPVRSII